MDYIPNHKTAIYKAWAQMKWVCNTNNPKFKPDYKDKGISYEANFADFDKFWKALRYGWCKGAKLARKDTTKWFTENNCYWILPKGAKPYKKASCISGVWGVVQITDPSGNACWCIRTQDPVTKKRTAKCWSVGKYGEVNAFNLAVEFLRESKGKSEEN